MHWPNHPRRVPIAVSAPFRPWRGCSEPRRTKPGYRFRRHGYYTTHRRWRIPRFRCLTCVGTFSRQAFSVSCYSKQPYLLRKVVAGLVAGSAFRQLARSFECAPNTVARISARLGRHAMLLRAESLTPCNNLVDTLLTMSESTLARR